LHAVHTFMEDHMTRQHINRTKQTTHTIPKITSSRSSQVSRSILQRVIEHPTEENLTPSVVQQLQATHGNQVVNRLVKQAKQNSMQSNQSTPTLNQTTQDTRTVQRKFAPKNDKEAKRRNKRFSKRQAGIPLVKAFDNAYATVNSTNTLKPAFAEWLESKQKSTGFFNRRQRGRFVGYKTPDDILTNGNKSDISNLFELAKRWSFGNELEFQQAVLTFKQTPSADSFHHIMDTFVYEGSELQANINSDDLTALTERAYRMLENELDDDGNPKEDTDFFEGANMSQNKLYTG